MPFGMDMMESALAGEVFLLWLIFQALVVVALVLAIRFFWQRTGARTSERDALRVLEERFDRGEIDREEFEGRRRILRS